MYISILMWQGFFVGVFISFIAMCKIVTVVVVFLCMHVNSTFLGCNSLLLDLIEMYIAATYINPFSFCNAEI